MKRHRLLLVAVPTLAAALLTSSSLAMGATPTRLKANDVKQIALRAAQPYVRTNNGSTGSLMVDKVQVGFVGKKVVWLAFMQAPAFLFPCKTPPSGPPAPNCPPGVSKYALVTISDTTGRVVSIERP